MTSSTTFPTLDFTRDRYGRPLIDQPDGKPKPYTRVSGYGSVLENQFALTKWKYRTLIRGAIARQDLLTMAASRIWDDRHLDAIAEDMQEAGGSSTAANIGTAIHDVLARLDAGEITVDQVPSEFRPHADAWLACLAAHGLEVVPNLVEIHLVNDTYEAAGSADNFVRRISDGKLIALDKKTGKQINARPLGYMVQLALYAGAQRYDVTTGERTEIGDVDDTVAYIAHIPADGSGCSLYAVDLVASRDLCDLARQVRAAEKAAPKVEKVTAPTDDLLARRIEWVKARLSHLLDQYPNAAEMVVRLWPDGVAGFKTNHAHTHDQVDKVSAVLTTVEAEMGVAFGDLDPRLIAERPAPRIFTDAERLTQAFPDAVLVDDEGEPDTSEVERVRAAVAALPDTERAWVEQVVRQAAEAKKPLSLRQNASKRRLAAVWACVDLAPYGEDASLIEVILNKALGSSQPIHKPGGVLGAMNLPQIARVREIVQRLDDGDLRLVFQADTVVGLAETNTNKNQENQ